jgi:hypothetical protein
MTIIETPTHANDENILIENREAQIPDFVKVVGDLIVHE